MHDASSLALFVQAGSSCPCWQTERVSQGCQTTPCTRHPSETCALDTLRQLTAARLQQGSRSLTQRLQQLASLQHACRGQQAATCSHSHSHPGSQSTCLSSPRTRGLTQRLQLLASLQRARRGQPGVRKLQALPQELARFCAAAPGRC